MTYINPSGRSDDVPRGEGNRGAIGGHVSSKAEGRRSESCQGALYKVEPPCAAVGYGANPISPER